MPWETITSRRNPLLMHIRTLLSSRQERERCGEYVCDGEKLLEEALLWNAPVKVLLCTHPERVTPPPGARLVQLPPEVMESVSPMKAPQGVLLVMQMPCLPLPEKLTGRHYLLLDGVQDPGNVGTILRSADAFGCDGVFLTGGSADLYNAKTVRSAMGALFRSPVWQVERRQLADLLKASALPLYGAFLGADTVELPQADVSRCMWAVGSEGKGLSREILSLCDLSVKIPMTSRCESLNAAMAATVLLWESYRRER